MGSMTLTNYFVLLAVLLYIAIQKTESTDPSINIRKEKDLSPMWFGPRIGRKKRNQENKLYRNEKDQSGFLDILKDSPLVVVAVSEAAKQHNFIPRLGRESGENAPPNWLEERDLIDSDSVPPRIPSPFSFPLERTNYSPFLPRLGREID